MNRATYLTALAVVLLLTVPAFGQSRYSGNGHYYEAVSTSATWTGARDAASKKTYSGMSGHLVSITSSGENDFIRSTVLSGKTGSWWIGAYQDANAKEPAGDWQWVTGESFSYTNWNSGEPNDSSGEDVAEFYSGNGYWNDNKTSSTRNYVVEYEPIAEVVINSDDGATSETSVTLTLRFESADDAGTPQVRVRNAGGSWSGWSTYSTSMSWTIPTGEGTKTVEVEFQDDYGFSYLAEDDISLDLTAPTGKVVIEGGAAWTNDTTVALDLTYQDQHSAVASMRFRNPGESWTAWMPAASSASFTMTSGEGVRVVEAQFLDEAGNTSSEFGDSIVVDQTPPDIDLTAANGEGFIILRTVPLTISATDTASGVRDMRFRERGVGSWSDWTPYATSHVFQVSRGGGATVIEIEVSDRAGNVGAAASNSVTLDTTPPEIQSFRINGGDPYVLPGENLEFEIYGKDNPQGSGVEGFKASFDGGTTWSAWYSLVGGYLTKVARPVEDGLVQVKIVVRDGVGHESDVGEAETYLIEEDLPVATGGGKLSGTLSPKADVDGFLVDLVKGDALSVNVKGKSNVKGQDLLLAVDIVASDGRGLHLGRYPSDAKKVMIKGFVAPKTDRYYVLLRFDPQSVSTTASHSLSAKVKQSKASKKGAGKSAGEEIRFEAAHGALLKATLKGSGLTAAHVTLIGPDGPVTFTPKEGKGSVTILTELGAGTGAYTIRIDPAVDVAWKWKLKLPKKIKTTIQR
jgi:hypothetical protein